MFSVDYTTLEQIIRQFMHTGIFRARVMKSRLSPEEGAIELQAKEGIVIACRFVTRQGKVDVWDRWDVRLARFGVLNWELTPDDVTRPKAEPDTGPLPGQISGALPVSNHSIAPHQLFSPHPQQMRQLPMLYRQVYYLIDGKRQASDIALVLHRSEQEVTQIFNELGRLGLIALK